MIGQLAKAVIDGTHARLRVYTCGVDQPTNQVYGYVCRLTPPTLQLHPPKHTGIQNPHPDFPTLPPAAATMKHFIAYGNSRFGHDRAPVDVSDRTVRQT